MTASDFILIFSELVLMLAVGVIAGRLAERLDLPKVAGELAGGILLGPTLFGLFFPDIAGFLFPMHGPVFIVREKAVKLGLLFFLFIAGLEINSVQIKNQGRSIIWSSLFGMVIPFTLGWLFVMVFPEWIGSVALNRGTLAFFLGTALSISALPVIAKILLDLGLIRHRFGTLVMSAATIDDLAGWTLFSALLVSFQGGHVSVPVLGGKILFLFCAVAAVLFLEQPIQKFFSRFQSSRYQSLLIPLALAAAFSGAMLAEAAGMHAVFGAFLTGALFAPGVSYWGEIHTRVFRFISHFLAPLYFVSVGLKINFIAHFDFVLVAAVLVIACLGKIIGVTLGARLGGLELRESLALGFAMNARGAMEMILAAIALEHGIIDERLFVALVVMALVTSVLSGPVIRRLLLVHKP